MLPVLIVFFALHATDRSYELHGRLHPAPRMAFLALDGAYTAFVSETTAGPDGKFRFSKLAPGTYTLYVQAEAGEMRRTIEIAPQGADRKGRIEMELDFEPEGAPRGATVAVNELAIPEQARAEHRKAIEALSALDLADARAHLKEALGLAPHYAQAWNLLGNLDYRAKRYGEAEADFRTALKQRPDATEPLVNLGGVLINLGRCREALDVNRRAVAKRPKDALAYSQLGMSHYCLCQDAPALKFLDRAVELDPRHYSNPQLVRADIYRRRGEPGRAVAEIEDFLQLRPNAPNADAVRRWLAAIQSGGASRGACETAAR